jgi:cytochrome c-type biogenesis protein CcmH/NrfG
MNMEIDGKKIPGYFRVVGWISAGVVVAGLLVIYNTEVPSAQMEQSRLAAMSETGRQVPVRTFASRVPKAGASALMDMPLDKLTDRLAKRLETAPDDLEGWTLLARSYSMLGQADKSMQAFSHAIEIDPYNADLRVTMGETLVSAAEGKITPEAKRSFVQGSAIDPGHPGVRYYLALADYQAAYRTWRALAKATPPAAPWQKRAESRLAEAQVAVADAGQTKIQ